MGNSLNKEQLQELLVKKFIEMFGCQPQGQDLLTTSFEDMNVGSLDVVEYIMEIEDELEISISIDVFDNIQEIVDCIYLDTSEGAS